MRVLEHDFQPISEILTKSSTKLQKIRIKLPSLSGSLLSDGRVFGLRVRKERTVSPTARTILFLVGKDLASSTQGVGILQQAV